MRDRLARAGVAWFTMTRRSWTHGHGTRSIEKDWLDLGAETRLTWGDAPEEIRTPALLRYRIGGYARPADRPARRPRLLQGAGGEGSYPMGRPSIAHGWAQRHRECDMTTIMRLPPASQSQAALRRPRPLFT
ncbi:hypothetical protein Pmi06nite_19320 [Planotetraspora mira]|uniref:Uncharacterized protein n=1 Tax=Planotetraspora mira TaxID=58121 RepID=A0A8J3X5G5_9ACTN|nr:hypothetical protein Pmi06nite_19320 [Planotetraspora mira]